jgi:cobalamin biosynthesis protein CobT
MQLDMIEFKSADEPWNDTTRARLANIGPQACNLDGHTLQFYRKQLEKRREEIKILHYYTDGAMPLENFDEELVILREEILRYRQRQIVLAGVGVRTDSPKEHGLPTVIVESQADVIKVVEDLEQWLTRR